MIRYGWVVVLCFISFIVGFVNNYNQWVDRAVNGEIVEVKGKVYKIVEIKISGE